MLLPTSVTKACQHISNYERSTRCAADRVTELTWRAGNAAGGGISMQLGARGAMPSIPGGMQMQQGPPGPMTQLLQQDGPPPLLHGSPALLNAPGVSEVLFTLRGIRQHTHRTSHNA